MNTKYVIILFYDIPNTDSEQQRKYAKFNKYIKSVGFVMMQESVYLKNVNSKDKYAVIKRDLKMISPDESNVRSLLVTEKLFNNIELINGVQTFKEKIISKKIRVLEL